ncbi:MAG: hypothetical protein ACK5AL_11835 [Planctomycetota bacterium]
MSTSSRSTVSFVLCSAILVGSLSYAFLRRYEKCPDDLPVPVTADPPAAVSPPVNVEPARAAAADAPIERVQIVDTESAERIAKLEAENARLRAELAAVQFASVLTTLAPEGEPVSIAQVMHLMDSCYLTEHAEDRAAFAAEVNPTLALALLRDEPAFRTRLADTRSKGTPDFLRYEWPQQRDRLVSGFLRRLADAGLSGRAIERYRASLADYLSP